MWPTVIVLYFLLTNWTECHIPEYQSTPSDRLQQYCILAETCIHDTIPICGKMDTETRTFLDICDLLEHACDTNNIYIHVEDMPGCPEKKTPVS